ncbi:S41 family peptidase [Angustibacter luteus]|uniref:S41 family peptidase n=1 Tax=Angustibacter luteus TaxID=658456 RepID=A0ABW1JA92_9ACTN
MTSSTIRPANTVTEQVSPPLIAEVIEESARLVDQHYVFPDVGADLARLLRQRLADGGYDGADAEQLADLVTQDLRSLNGDGHLGLRHHHVPVPAEQGAATLSRMRSDFDVSLGGVPLVRLLDGGVALLKLSPALFPLAWAAQPLAAALTLVAPASALILDVRGNGGGDPDTVAFICSYLLDERTHLNTMHWRDGERRERDDQSWTLPHVPGARFGGTKPVYVLIDGRTFSGAEELAYDLQQLGRAVVVGEPSGGGAQPYEGWTVHPHLEVTVPTGRGVNPVSGTNWEGVGVQPDVACADADALVLAHEAARVAAA